MCFGSPKISDKQQGNCKCAAQRTYACVLALIYVLVYIHGCRCMFPFYFDWKMRSIAKNRI